MLSQPEICAAHAEPAAGVYSWMKCNLRLKGQCPRALNQFQFLNLQCEVGEGIISRQESFPHYLSAF